MITCALNVTAVIATWQDAEIKVLVSKSRENPSFPELLITKAKPSPRGHVEKLVSSLVIDGSRIHYHLLPVQTMMSSESLNASIPYLCLCPSDVISSGGFDLVSMDMLIKESGSSPSGQMLEDARVVLRDLVGTSTACLHLLPSFFSNAEIKSIHNFMLGGEVNRMTLRRRFEDTGYVKQTGEKVPVKQGRQPSLMMSTIETLHVFGVMISTT